ncbi:MAG: hypothetical protein PHF67_01040 [Candidatus Nanoarchaeia archaeon]|nr:hypothetical protein [Candidatus Nanoarchaeia archaeon]
MEIKKNTKNELFKRYEVSIILESDKNPSFSEVKKKLSEKFSKPEDSIDVYNIKGKFGRNTFLIKAYVYDSKADFEKAVQKTKKQRDAEKKAAEEAKKAEEEAKKAAEEAKKAEAEVKSE